MFLQKIQNSPHTENRKPLHREAYFSGHKVGIYIHWERFLLSASNKEIFPKEEKFFLKDKTFSQTTKIKIGKIIVNKDDI